MARMRGVPMRMRQRGMLCQIKARQCAAAPRVASAMRYGAARAFYSVALLSLQAV